MRSVPWPTAQLILLELLREYRTKPVLPGPLILLCLLWRLFCRRQPEAEWSCDELDQLSSFQELHTDKYCAKVRGPIAAACHYP